jgi:hypothetical protein
MGPTIQGVKSRDAAGAFLFILNIKACKWVQKAQMCTKWQISTKEEIVMAYFQIDEL